MATTPALAIAFASGFLIECACVFWVHYSERGAPAKTAFFSMIVGSAQVLGIGESIRDPWASGAFVLGYGTGTYITVRFLKRRLDKSSP
jgi:hypothetical protein